MTVRVSSPGPEGGVRAVGLNHARHGRVTEAKELLRRFVASGFVPKFYDDLQRRGIPVNMSIFREE
jgi:pentatricopeptide repeat protein